MAQRADGMAPWIERRLTVVVALLLAAAVTFWTWIGLTESRRDSLRLLVIQGTAFTEALAEAAKGAIEAEAFYDYLIHLRYEEIFVTVSQIRLDAAAAGRLNETAVMHDLAAIYLLDLSGSVLASGFTPTESGPLPDFVLTEARSLGANPQTNYMLLLEPAVRERGPRHYYLQISNTLDRIVVLVGDARYYVEALEQTQIGYLVQKMSREPSVEYIMYQSPDGIIFSSQRVSEVLSIESDPFLEAALDSDTIVHRRYRIQDQDVLELVRPFATSEYPFGLFRVGLSLDRYNAVSRRFDLQMALLSAALFGLLLVGVLYIQSRRTRRELGRRYTDIKSLTDVIFEQMHTGVAAIDGNGIVTLANGALERILAARNLVGRPWDEAAATEALSMAQLRRLMDSGAEEEITLQKDKRDLTLVVAVSPFGKPPRDTGLVLVAYDVTRLKEFERRALRRARLSEMGDMAAGVAHEIRNPLNTISIAAQRLAAEFTPRQNPDDYAAFTAQIRSETKRLNEIITKFLALAREDRRVRTPLDLDDFLREIYRFLRLEAEPLNIRLELHTEPGLIVAADAGGLRQVITNLFRNAKEALAGNAGEFRITSWRDQNDIVLAVEDSGPGVPPDHREKVFTPYFTTKDTGTGLGLPTVHRIVAEMGGEILLEQSDLGGAKFIIRLEQHRESAPPDTP